MAKRQSSTQREECSAYKKLKTCSEELEKSVDSAGTADEPSNYPSLLDLSDDILLIILSHLHPIDIEALSKTNSRLNIICHDRTLWTEVDFRPYPLLASGLEKFIEFFLPITKSIACCGPSLPSNEAQTSPPPAALVDPPAPSSPSPPPPPSSSPPLPPPSSSHPPPSTPPPPPAPPPPPVDYTMTHELMEAISRQAYQLRKLILENQRINTSELLLEYFPSSLEHLELKSSILENMPSQQSYFFDVKTNLPYLKVLDLTGNKWFLPHSLLALSKSATLKELILAKCMNLCDCVPYASLAALYGFRSLQVLDLRGTLVEDSDVSCFNRISTLRQLYLEAPAGVEGGRRLITDMCVTSFGGVRAHHNHPHAPHHRAAPGQPPPHHHQLELNRIGVLLLEAYPWRVQQPSQLTCLVVRNYTAITDISLKHAGTCLPNLTSLDVSGTSCTEAGVRLFQQQRSDVTLLSDYPATLPLPLPLLNNR
ncbi:hypothetical protein LSTR_LSTR003866 [Laodelphax striatellus]|uniref:F-box domain-containing protein n=1 Tax=Laodelphax striatellus TaxID=195883 RepID=A0A482XEH8_LAOST|nr:hypothetical protein LSTR_LSTR003866 [Laodelphax striatellus]